MSAARKSFKQPVNLSLSQEAIRQAGKLKKELNRPSISNVVEFLLAQAVKANERERLAA